MSSQRPRAAAYWRGRFQCVIGVRMQRRPRLLFVVDGCRMHRLPRCRQLVVWSSNRSHDKSSMWLGRMDSQHRRRPFALDDSSATSDNDHAPRRSSPRAFTPAGLTNLCASAAHSFSRRLGCDSLAPCTRVRSLRHALRFQPGCLRHCRDDGSRQSSLDVCLGGRLAGKRAKEWIACMREHGLLRGV